MKIKLFQLTANCSRKDENSECWSNSYKELIKKGREYSNHFFDILEQTSDNQNTNFEELNNQIPQLMILQQAGLQNPFMEGRNLQEVEKVCTDDAWEDLENVFIDARNVFQELQNEKDKIAMENFNNSYEENYEKCETGDNIDKCACKAQSKLFKKRCKHSKKLYDLTDGGKGEDCTTPYVIDPNPEPKDMDLCDAHYNTDNCNLICEIDEVSDQQHCVDDNERVLDPNDTDYCKLVDNEHMNECLLIPSDAENPKESFMNFLSNKTDNADRNACHLLKVYVRNYCILSSVCDVADDLEENLSCIENKIMNVFIPI